MARSPSRAVEQTRCAPWASHIAQHPICRQTHGRTSRTVCPSHPGPPHPRNGEVRLGVPAFHVKRRHTRASAAYALSAVRSRVLAGTRALRRMGPARRCAPAVAECRACTEAARPMHVHVRAATARAPSLDSAGFTWNQGLREKASVWSARPLQTRFNREFASARRPLRLQPACRPDLRTRGCPGHDSWFHVERPAQFRSGSAGRPTCLIRPQLGR